MYLKVSTGKEDLYYRFDDGSSVKIGRGSSNDINLSTEGLSRNHLQIQSSKNGEYYVIDLGATNGSFINEEKLVPNKKFPFNTFFPVQLGFHVKLHLIDESRNTAALDELVKKTKESI